MCSAEHSTRLSALVFCSTEHISAGSEGSDLCQLSKMFIAIHKREMGDMCSVHLFVAPFLLGDVAFASGKAPRVWPAERRGILETNK